MAERKIGEIKVFSPQTFINKLYDSVQSYLVDERRAEIIKEYKEVEVNNWESYSDYPPGNVVLGAYAEKALLLQNDKNVYALVLSNRLRSRYQHGRSIGVEFGYFPKDKRAFERFNADTPVEELRLLVHQGRITYGSGEFYEDNILHRVVIDCWADKSRFGGDEVYRWPAERFHTKEGIIASMLVIKRLERNAFVGI